MKHEPAGLGMALDRLERRAGGSLVSEELSEARQKDKGIFDLNEVRDATRPLFWRRCEDLVEEHMSEETALFGGKPGQRGRRVDHVLVEYRTLEGGRSQLSFFLVA
jgi:hypothetical protein